MAGGVPARQLLAQDRVIQPRIGAKPHDIVGARRGRFQAESEQRDADVDLVRVHEKDAVPRRFRLEPPDQIGAAAGFHGRRAAEHVADTLHAGEIAATIQVVPDGVRPAHRPVHRRRPRQVRMMVPHVRPETGDLALVQQQMIAIDQGLCDEQGHALCA